MMTCLSTLRLRRTKSCVIRSRPFSSTNVRFFVPTPNPPSLTLAACVALGLPLALWSYKCLAMVLFQRKLIYMGYMPMGSREERVDAYRHQLRDLDLQEIQIRNDISGITLHGITVSRRRQQQHTPSNNNPRATIVYFQGNAGNPLHRIPIFKSLLGAISSILDVTIVAVAPRSYWRSSLRTPTEAGLYADYNDVLRYVSQKWPGDPIFLLGHSLGASIAACLVSQLSQKASEEANSYINNYNIRGIILENAFSSVPDMVRTLYSSRWLPYRYLAPLAWDKWDVIKAACNAPHNSILKTLARSRGILVLQSENDEVVPVSMSWNICNALAVGSPILIRGALHENAWERKEWSSTIKAFLKELA